MADEGNRGGYHRNIIEQARYTNTTITDYVTEENNILTEHKQKEVYNPLYEEIVEVDEDIAELLEQLWALDILTFDACQESQPGTMWIAIPSFAVERFLDIIASNRDEEEDPSTSIYNRMMGMGWGGDWQYDALVSDLAGMPDEATKTIIVQGKSVIALHVYIRFPKSDYDEVLAAVKNHEEPPEENEDESNSSPFSLN